MNWLPPFLRPWLLLLGGPTIWFAHFGFIYAAASIELTFSPRAGLPSRIAIAVGTLLALALLWGLWRQVPTYAPGEPRGELYRFWTGASALLIFVSAVAILWQALPALMVG